MGKKTEGRRGPRGPKGKRGVEGKRGVPGIEPADIHAIIENIEKVRDEAAVQFKRIAQIQVQLDVTLKALKDMGDRAGRQRKKR
jgi:hypothetical protein